jgi:hypothetical protein
MVVVIEKNSDLNKIKKLIAQKQSVKKFDAKHFCGLLKADEDALKVQHRLRDEWK